jgi:hypothetical protein
MATMNMLRVLPVQPPQRIAQVTRCGDNEQMDVGVHEHKRQKLPAMPLDRLLQQPEVHLAIEVVPEQRLASDRMSDHVEWPIGEIRASRSRHIPLSRDPHAIRPSGVNGAPGPVLRTSPVALWFPGWTDAG